MRYQVYAYNKLIESSDDLTKAYVAVNQAWQGNTKLSVLFIIDTVNNVKFSLSRP